MAWGVNLAGIAHFLKFATAKLLEGNEDRSLLLFLPMNPVSQLHELERRVEALISAEPSLFLVEVRLLPGNNIKVFIDGDQGVSIEKLVAYNRAFYRQIEDEGLFGGDFSLELSSPGLDEPLKLHRQYIKNKGRFVEVMEKDGVKKEGKLVEATGESIIIEEEKGKGKKRETVQHMIPFENIKTTKVQIKF